MSNSNRSDIEKEQFWRLVLAEHASSRLNVRAFCKRESLSEPSFYSWRRKIHSRDLPQTANALPVGLVPVDVIEELPAENHVIEIVVPGNIVVQVKEHCSAGAMSRVLIAVRETFSC